LAQAKTISEKKSVKLPKYTVIYADFIKTTGLLAVFTACSELRKVLFLVLSDFVCESNISWSLTWTSLTVKVKVTRDKFPPTENAL